MTHNLHTRLSSDDENAQTPALGRALSMIARRPSSQGLAKVANVVVEAASPKELVASGCGNRTICAL